MNLARTQASLESFCRRVKRNYAEEIHATNPNTGWSSWASGAMARFFSYDVIVYKNSFEVTFELEQPDGYVQEFGLDSGYGAYSLGGKFPNIEEIKDWIADKNDFRFEYLTGKRFGLPMTLNETAFLVSRKIAQEGFSPRYFFERAVENAFPYLEQDIVDKFGLDVDDFLNQLEIYE